MSLILEAKISNGSSMRTKIYTVLVRKIVGEESAYPLEKIKYQVVKYNAERDVSIAIKEKIQWMVTIGNEKKVYKNNGDIFFLRIKREWENKEICVFAYIEEPDNSVCFKTRIKELHFPIVVDKYKMPGINRDLTNIADDMSYGYGEKNRFIYDKLMLNRYKEEYIKEGFNESKHSFFSNDIAQSKNVKSIYSKEQIFNASYKLPISILGKNLDISTGLDVRVFDNFSDDILIWDFKETTSLYFAKGILEKNIRRMIDKFAKNEGGVYEHSDLTNAVIANPRTKDYLEKVDQYIKSQMEMKSNRIIELEDFIIYCETNKLRRIEKGKDFTRPIYNNDTFGGLRIALNDIWASEVSITNATLIDENYCEIDYSVILWDHFGLDLPDMEKVFNIIPSVGECFVCWFILQHLRGYRPFITKIPINRKIKIELK